jgi:hypothetical protein
MPRKVSKRLSIRRSRKSPKYRSGEIPSTPDISRKRTVPFSDIGPKRRRTVIEQNIVNEEQLQELNNHVKSLLGTKHDVQVSDIGPLFQDMLVEHNFQKFVKYFNKYKSDMPNDLDTIVLTYIFFLHDIDTTKNREDAVKDFIRKWTVS